MERDLSSLTDRRSFTDRSQRTAVAERLQGVRSTFTVS